MTGDVLVLRAHAKINLHLDVIGRLPDGYHAIETLFQSIELADTLSVRRTGSGVTVDCGDPDVPTGQDNLIVRAATLFFAFAGIDGGAHVELEKVIPLSAGLGGSSADAAATLVGLNALFGMNYPNDTLERLGSALGADVPFCVRGGTAWGRGTGTILRSYPPFEAVPVLLVNSGAQVSTADAYRDLGIRRPALASRQFGLTGLERGDKIVRGWKDALSHAQLSGGSGLRPHNSFESVAFRVHPELEEIRDGLREFGAPALMSGSGATVHGVFRESASLDAAERAFSRRFPFVVRTAFARSGVL